MNKAADFSFAPSKTQWTVGPNGRRDTNQHQIVESDFVLLPRSALSDFKDQTREPNMGRFIRRQNVERYWRLLDRVTNESDRQRMLELLVEERQKQRDAGDEFI